MSDFVSRKRILIIDDEPDLAYLFMLNLRSMGYQVRTAGTAADGLAAAKEMKPNLVIVDLSLPDMDGLEVCRILRRTSSVPILILTARIESDPAVRAGYLAKGYGYLGKPVSLSVLADKVKHCLLKDGRRSTSAR